VEQRLRTGQKLTVDAYDRTFTTKLDTGVLSNLDNEIDTTTGTLKLRAMFNNSSFELFPNQFVNARLTLDTLHDQLLIPGAAVQQGATGNFVYVVDEAAPAGSANAPLDPPPGAAGRQGRSFGGFNGLGAAAGPIRLVHVRYVTTGPAVGNFVSISQGLQLGETVVVDGAEQLRDAARVIVPPPGAGVTAGQDGAAAGAPSGAGDSGYGGQRGAGGHRMHRGGGQRPANGPAPGAPAAPAAAASGTGPAPGQ
jgi:multidrug efflux system membrane fusion protein